MNTRAHTAGSYPYSDARPTYANAYLWPVLREQIAARTWLDKRAFDLGCGNGATTHMLSELGFAAVGVDPSESGIAQARTAFPQVRCEVGKAEDDLAAKYGTFPLLVSLEVIEHVYDPRAFAISVYNLLQPGGLALISTPYHGYLKNLALAASGRLDQHFTALWDGGHIKFFSVKTLTQLLTEAGFASTDILRIGRVPTLAKSMMAISTRTSSS